MSNVYLKTFNKQFEDFLNDINNIFPNNEAIITARNSLIMLKKFNPKLLIGVWHQHIYIPYKKSIDDGDIDFFINKDYTNDISQMEDAKKIMTEIDNFRKPIREMDTTNQGHCMKYIQNLSKLSCAYIK